MLFELTQFFQLNHIFLFYSTFLLYFKLIVAFAVKLLSTLLFSSSSVVKQFFLALKALLYQLKMIEDF